MHSLFHNKPWDVQARIEAENLLGEISKIAPELTVLFMGATALGIPGKNDIDIDILCDVKDIRKYAEKLRTVLGPARELTDSIAAWTFMKNGYEVDAILSDPRTSHVPEQKKVFDILRQNKKLLEEYKQLKEECDGKSYLEYEEKKNEFFKNKVLSSL